MIDLNLDLQLPSPWNNEPFHLDQVSPINYLVGPNGSGKSRFATTLAQSLENSRLLPTDRLTGMEQNWLFGNIYTQQFNNGLARGQFANLKSNSSVGSGMTALVLLEERMDLRMQVEATLAHLFDREIRLQWDSGNLVAMTRRRGNNALYRLDRDECHGIKELCILLTNLYDDTINYLIVDEPELNLHPQYQAFLVREARKVAGDPAVPGNKKIIFLVTHSPFVLDFRSYDDLKSVISFGLDYSVPKRPQGTLKQRPSSASFVNRLNAHPKQLFFSDNPVFVEGILDAQIVTAIMEASGVAVEGAGSCIIDAGGADEVNHYLGLCLELGKSAHFMYDLDSLFTGSLRQCIGDDQSIQSFLATAGLGNDFGVYCGQLDRALGPVIECIRTPSLPESFARLAEYLNSLVAGSGWDRGKWGKARTAVMSALSKHREGMISVLGSPVVKDLEGRRNQIADALRERNIHLLTGGSLERYLPSYSGDEYALTGEEKKKAVLAELEQLTLPITEAGLRERYGDLYTAISHMPSKAEVDVEPVIRSYLSDYVHHLQKLATDNSDWQREELEATMLADMPSMARVFSVRSFERSGQLGFRATISIISMLNQPTRVAYVSNRTVAGTGDFTIEMDAEQSGNMRQ